jgi:hypothetical protein
MTREEIEKEILEYPFKEAIAALVGLAVAMQELREQYSGDIDGVPGELGKFIKRFIEVTEEQESK